MVVVAEENRINHGKTTSRMDRPVTVGVAAQTTDVVG